MPFSGNGVDCRFERVCAGGIASSRGVFGEEGLQPGRELTRERNELFGHGVGVPGVRRGATGGEVGGPRGATAGETFQALPDRVRRVSVTRGGSVGGRG